MRIDEENMLLHWLYSINGIGRKTLQKLISNLGSAKRIYEIPEKELDYFLKPSQKKSFMDFKYLVDPLKHYNKLLENNIRFIDCRSKDFPQRLLDIPDPPYALYVKGDLPDQSIPSIAVIGARLCSEYGRYMARNFGRDFASAGFQIVSGMAAGIDSVAEKAAISVGGRAYSVMGCGADICYPEENRDLYEECSVRGGIISEYPISTKPAASLFPPRNRIISGLCDVLIVIEARKKSGTLITVDMALEQGRDVYVLPGRVTDRLSDGCNSLIKQGAQVITDASDVISIFNYERGQTAEAGDKSQRPKEKIKSEHSMRGIKGDIISVLGIFPKTISEIEDELNKRYESEKRRQNIDAAELLRTMAEMELNDQIKRSEESYYIL